MENESQNVDRWQKFLIPIILFTIPIVVITFLYVSKTSSPEYDAAAIKAKIEQAHNEMIERQIASTKWIPKDFVGWDRDIAYKWVEDPDCDYFSVCAAIQVVTNIDCPRNIYAELTLMDEDYVQYDYTNDLQGSLLKGSIAELTFNWAPDGKFAHFKVSKINCN